jgi:hypothetical protein
VTEFIPDLATGNLVFTNSGTSGGVASYVVDQGAFAYFPDYLVSKTRNVARNVAYLSHLPNLPANNIQNISFSTASSALNTTYVNILYRQCYRVQVFIGNQLHNLEWQDEEANGQVVNRIAEAIDLVGEPGIYAAYQQLAASRNNRLAFETLLWAVSVAKDKSTERHRVTVLTEFSREPDQAVRYNAVEALGNMATYSESAQRALREISRSETNREIANMAAAYSR